MTKLFSQRFSAKMRQWNARLSTERVCYMDKW